MHTLLNSVKSRPPVFRFSNFERGVLPFFACAIICLFVCPIRVCWPPSHANSPDTSVCCKYIYSAPVLCLFLYSRKSRDSCFQSSCSSLHQQQIHLKFMLYTHIHNMHTYNNVTYRLPLPTTGAAIQNFLGYVLRTRDEMKQTPKIVRERLRL